MLPLAILPNGEAVRPDEVSRVLIEAVPSLVEEAGAAEGLSGAGMVITGSVVTAGAARTLFGKDPR